jgi:hypothetical protein
VKSKHCLVQNANAKAFGYTYLVEYYGLFVILNVMNLIIQVALDHIFKDEQWEITNVVSIRIGCRMDSCSMPAKNEVHSHAPPPRWKKSQQIRKLVAKRKIMLEKDGTGQIFMLHFRCTSSILLLLEWMDCSASRYRKGIKQ